MRSEYRKLVCCAAVCWSAVVSGHDLRGAAVQEAQSASPALANALADTPIADATTRSVLSNLRLWTVPRKLTVCFLSGTPELRARVVAAIQSQWRIAELTSGRLDYDASNFALAPDCNPNPSKFDIRIDFAKGSGHWSYVGIESLRHVPSLNLDGFADSAPANPDFSRLVGHEMGHALGLEHEHQSPKAPECGWNFDYIFTHYAWDSEEQMKNNLQRLTDYIQQSKHAYVFSSYDQKSEMHYYFEPDGFVAGAKSPCYISAQNAFPSDIDKNAIRIAYGVNVHTMQQLSKGAIPDIFKKLSGDQYNELRWLLSLKQDLLVK